MPERPIEFSPRRRDLVAFGLALSFALHASFYFALGRAALPPWPKGSENSALFGATFDVETLPAPAAEQGAQASASHSGSYDRGPSGDTSVEPSEPDPSRLKSSEGSAVGQPPAPRTPHKIPASSPPKPKPKTLKDAQSPGLDAPRAGTNSVRNATAGQTARERGEASGTGAYGQEGTAQARASLFAAFVRTLPLAGKLLPGWLDQPVGQKSKILVELRVDGTGRLREVELIRGDTKSLLARTALKNEAFLSHGIFAIRGEQGGQLLIELSSEVEEREPSSEEDASGRVVALGQRIAESPPGKPPTGAYFTYGNGRHIELGAAVVELAR